MALKPPEVTDKVIKKMINSQLDLKQGQFIGEELKLVLTKIKNRKSEGPNEMSLKVWKTRKFDDMLFQLWNTNYKQNTIEKWTKGCILFFSKKGELGIVKNYRSITLTSITAKVFYVLLLYCIEPEIKKILKKNLSSFWRNWSTISQILTIHQIIKGVCTKNLEATLS